MVSVTRQSTRHGAKKNTCVFSSLTVHQKNCVSAVNSSNTLMLWDSSFGRSGLLPSLQTWWNRLQDVYLLVINGVIIPVNGLTIGLRGVITPISGVITLLITGTVHLVGFRWTSFWGKKLCGFRRLSLLVLTFMELELLEISSKKSYKTCHHSEQKN